MHEPVNLAAVSTTAVFISWTRLRESQRPDRLFEDPMAGALLTAAKAVVPDGLPRTWTEAVPAATMDYFALRTRFLDDYLRECAADGIRQVGIVASGLDTRAYRLDWPAGTRVYELDLPAVIDFKRQALAGVQPRCALTTLGTDLAGDWVADLLATDFDPGQPTAWLTEGIFAYLTSADADRLLGLLAELSPAGARLGAEHLTNAMLTGEPGRLWRERMGPGVRWRSAVDDPADWFGRHGWRATVTTNNVEQGGRYGRPLPPGTFGVPDAWFATATRDL